MRARLRGQPTSAPQRVPTSISSCHHSTAERWSARSMADSGRADPHPTPVTAPDAAARPRTGTPPAGHRRGSRWRVLDGFDGVLSRRESGSPRGGGRLWMDEHPVTVAEFRRFVKATGRATRPRCRGPDGLSGRNAGGAGPGSARLGDPGGGAARRLPDAGGPGPGSRLAPSGGPWEHRRWPRATPRHPCVVLRRQRLRSVVRQGPAHRGRVGVRRPQQLDRKRFAWGDDELVRGRRQANTWQLPAAG